MNFKKYALIIIVMIAAYIATDIYMPSLPAIVVGFHTTKSLAQSTLTIFLLGFGIAQFTYGILSDKYGRKPMLILGILIFLVGSIATLLATSINMLLFGRLIQGLGIGASAALSRVFLRDVFKGKDLIKAISYISPIVVLTPAVAPVVGGYLQAFFGYKGSFIFMFLYGILALAIVIFLIPETNRSLNKDAIKINSLLSNFQNTFASPSFIINLFSAALGFSTIIIFSAVNPFLLQNFLHVSPQDYGLLALFMSSSLAIGMFLNGRVIEYFSRNQLVIFGFSLLFLAGFTMLTTALLLKMTIAIIIIPTFIAFLGVAFIGPNSASKVFECFPSIAGFVGAIYGATQVLLSSLGGVIASLLRSNNQEHVAILILVVSALGLSLRLLQKLKVKPAIPLQTFNSQ